LIPDIELLEYKWRKGKDPDDILGKVCNKTTCELVNKNKNEQQHSIVIGINLRPEK